MGCKVITICTWSYLTKDESQYELKHVLITIYDVIQSITIEVPTINVS